MTGLTRKEAAELAGVSEDTIKGWVTTRAPALLLPWPSPAVHQAMCVTRNMAAPRRGCGSALAGRSRSLRASACGCCVNRQGSISSSWPSRPGSPRGNSPPGTWRSMPLAPTVHQLSQALGVAPERFVDDTPSGSSCSPPRKWDNASMCRQGGCGTGCGRGCLPGVKVGGEWRVPAIAVAELDRSGRLRGASRRLDPRYRG